MTTFIIKTLGCKVNQYESQLVREDLIKNGLKESPDARADLFIVNTCTVTHKADRDSRNIIRSCKTKNPASKVLVTGCYVEKDRDIIAKIEGVDFIVGNKDKADIYKVIAKQYKKENDTANPRISSFSGHSRAFVKIQDGCNNKCSYCKVNIVRPGSVSRPSREVISEVGKLINNGIKEIVLCGICLGDYSHDGADLAGLLRLLLKIKGDWRLRLSSIEPKYVTDELIGLISTEEKICAHLHIPFQSGDDKILKVMNRGYTAKQMTTLVERIRKAVPQIAITTDIIVGFPGEKESNFKNTVGFLKSASPSRIHTFKYSRRPETPAASLKGEVAYNIIKERAKILADLNKQLSIDYSKRFIGKVVRVLVERVCDTAGKGEFAYLGYTDTYISMRFFSRGTFKESEFIDLLLEPHHLCEWTR